MGFHFDDQGEVGEERSKTPKLQGQSYNYHAFLYSMSCKDSLPSQKHQSRLSLLALKRPPVPPRQSSLPVFAPTYSLPERIPSIEGRTVSSMKNVLPLQLQAGVRAGGFDFSSWIDSTIEELRHPFNSENPAHKRRSQSMKDVPWMQEEQDTTFDTLQPRKHRETAVYSDPGSTIVSFPYCGCEGLGSNQFHRHSARADLDAGLPCPLFSKTNTPRCSGATLVNPLDSHSDTGINTFGRARAVSSVSAISPQSQEERAVRAAWMKPLPSPPSPIIPRIGDIISPTMFSPTTTEGCSSMPCTPGLILDAHSARLPSAKATVIQVSPRAPLMDEGWKFDRAATSPAMAPQSRNDMMSPLWGVSDLTPQSNSVNPPSHRRKLSASAIAGIVADITASVQEFPEKMLYLDTPCIVAIRHDMRSGKSSILDSTPVASTAATASSIEANMKVAADPTRYLAFQRQSSTVIRSQKVDKLLPPLPHSLRAATPPPARTSSPENTLRLLPDRYSPTMDMISYYSEVLTRTPGAKRSDESEAVETLKVPDLSPIAAIFPDSDSWWQSTLYAHLIAYNYITNLNIALQSRPSQRRQSRAVPDKAARTMGIPKMAIIGDSDTAYTKVPENLEKSMVRIMKSMMERKEGISGLSSHGGVLGRGELALLRALCQVVKMAGV